MVTLKQYLNDKAIYIIVETGLCIAAAITYGAQLGSLLFFIFVRINFLAWQNENHIRFITDIIDAMDKTTTPT